MTLDQALDGSAAPRKLLEQLSLIDVDYLDLQGRGQTGQLVVASDLASEVSEIFRQLFVMAFPIEHIEPIVAYHWDDLWAMEANLTSAYNYRTIMGTTKLSQHAYGRAIDINTRLNPYYVGDQILPAGAVYQPGRPGVIVAGDQVTELFKSYGWRWLGGDKIPDYQHFQKALL